MINSITGTNLHISDQFGACDKEQLDKYQIKHVFCMSSGLERQYPGIQYIYTPTSDDQFYNIVQHFDKLFSAFDATAALGENIVVNCQAGKSRSAAVVIGYLVHKGMSYDEAYNLLKSCRNIKPNVGFVEQLKLYASLNN